jgi:hypothetical protein
MNEIKSAKRTFWRWRVRQFRRDPLLQIVGLLGLLAGTMFFLSNLTTQASKFAEMKGLLVDPLFVLALVILVISQINLCYMEYKVQQKLSGGEPEASLIRRHRVVPQQYEGLYGSDMFVYIHRAQFAFIVLAAIAIGRWLLR